MRRRPTWRAQEDWTTTIVNNYHSNLHQPSIQWNTDSDITTEHRHTLPTCRLRMNQCVGVHVTANQPALQTILFSSKVFHWKNCNKRLISNHANTYVCALGLLNARGTISLMMVLSHMTRANDTRRIWFNWAAKYQNFFEILNFN